MPSRTSSRRWPTDGWCSHESGRGHRSLDLVRRRARRARTVVLAGGRRRARRRRRVRLRQERVGVRPARTAPGHRCEGRRLDPGRGRGRPGRRRHGTARAAGGEGRDGLPGPALLAGPVLRRRRPDRPGVPGPPPRLPAGGAGQGRRSAGPGRDSRRGTPFPVPAARVLRRNAPAGADRHGAGLRAAAADRRRADDRAGRHRPGPDPRPAARSAPRDGHGAAAGHP